MSFSLNTRPAILARTIPGSTLSNINSGLQVLLVASSRIEGELILGCLRTGGIRAHISADDEGGMNLALQPGRVRILVSGEDEAAAHRMLEDTKVAEKGTPIKFQKWLWKLLGGRLPDEN